MCKVVTVQWAAQPWCSDYREQIDMALYSVHSSVSFGGKRRVTQGYKWVWDFGQCPVIWRQWTREMSWLLFDCYDWAMVNTIYKRKYFIGFMVSDRFQDGRAKAWRQVSENSYLWATARRQTGNDSSLSKPQNLPPVMHLLQQECTS